jgi:hypothetical protein
MKTFHKIVLIIVATAFVTIFSLKSIGADPAPAPVPAKQPWEYLVIEGDPDRIRLRMEQKLNDGFQVDQLLGTPKGNGFTPHMFVVLKKAK